MAERLKPPNAGRGRPLGATNKTTRIVKGAIADFVAANVPGAQELYDRLAKQDPRAALELLATFCAFVVPRQARFEADVEARQAPIVMDIGISFANGGPGLPRVQRAGSDRDGVYVTPPQPTEDALPMPTAERMPFNQ